MADYPLKQEAAEVQDILDTSLTFNNKYPQALSEEEKAFTREKIGASAVGEGIKILSHFDTLEELAAAITSPKPGDAFSVGTELPYNLYIYDFMRGEWRNYGPIRANDIKARFAQNIAVAVSAWAEDANVFVDYTYRARIALAEVTGNDFPIVAFAPSDAISGNFCPIAYCFDGYIEIWAKSIPTAGITLPAATFIIQDTSDTVTGNSTKGITNASGGIATGGIDTEQIADGSITVNKVAAAAKTQYFIVTIPADWDGDVAPYSRSVAVDGMLATDIPKVFFYAPADFANLEAQQEAFALLYDVESANGTVTFYAKEKPEVAVTVMIEVSRI
jgi:hypothetical protein